MRYRHCLFAVSIAQLQSACPRRVPCGNCDVCIDGVDSWNGTIAAQEALSWVYRTGQRFGHDQLKTFGVGRELTLNEWRSIFRQLIAAGFLNVDIARRAGFRLNEKSWEILKGEQAVRFRKDKRLVKERKSLRPTIKTGFDISNTDDQELWEFLRNSRFKIARKAGVPPYVIFPDKTLKEMVMLRPTTPAGLLQVSGVGEVKLKRYGNLFLEAIRAAEDSK